ncbi:hypothetical protein GIW70_21640, partial [Pseudomonas syringae]|nr:hypothetical protein [Pseudomonas syringae]
MTKVTATYNRESKNFLGRPWSPLEIYVFFQLMTILHIVPILLADYPYNDDVGRGIFGIQGWARDGRPFADLLYIVLTFSTSMTNIFPLPLLIATVAMSFALRRLVTHYFSRAGFIECLVVLPLWCNPFFLQNLSYQYDGPSMVFGLVAVIYAVTIKGVHAGWCVAFSAILIAVALSFYQICLNVFIGLACVEIIHCISSGVSLRTILNTVQLCIAHLISGLFVYYLTAYQLIGGDRQGFVEPDSSGVNQILIRIISITDNIFLVFTAGNAWMFLSLAMVAISSFILVGYRVAIRQKGSVAKSITLVVYLCALLGLLLAVYGIDLFVRVSYP